jgi:hypothetical protein
MLIFAERSVEALACFLSWRGFPRLFSDGLLIRRSLVRAQVGEPQIYIYAVALAQNCSQSVARIEQNGVLAAPFLFSTQ